MHQLESCGNASEKCVKTLHFGSRFAGTKRIYRLVTGGRLLYTRFQSLSRASAIVILNTATLAVKAVRALAALEMIDREQSLRFVKARASRCLLEAQRPGSD